MVFPPLLLVRIGRRFSGMSLCIPCSGLLTRFSLQTDILWKRSAAACVTKPCSDGAGSYSVKFIFDRTKYLTRIVTTNEMVNGYDFLDGTATYDDR